MHNDTYPAIDSSKADLHGKSVFISGASKGIGRSTALSFAKAGASVIAIGARSDMTALEKDIKEAATSVGKDAPMVLRIKLDVSSQESIDKAAATIGKESGKLDIMINNAGVLGPPALIADSDPDQWWNDWIINVRGPYLMTRAFLPLMLKGGDKQIINICSAGAHCIFPSLSAYQPSKLAILRFTEFVAAEYGPHGVVSFCIHPGNIPTDIVGGPEGLPPELKHGSSLLLCPFFIGPKRELTADKYS